eukprot:518921-Amphidinium_carterae.1
MEHRALQTCIGRIDFGGKGMVRSADSDASRNASVNVSWHLTSTEALGAVEVCGGLSHLREMRVSLSVFSRMHTDLNIRVSRGSSIHEDGSLGDQRAELRMGGCGIEDLDQTCLLYTSDAADDTPC